MPEQRLVDLSPENLRIVLEILQRYVPEREVWAFGSRAKWTAKEYSDLDIAIIGGEPLELTTMANLTIRLNPDDLRNVRQAVLHALGLGRLAAGV